MKLYLLNEEVSPWITNMAKYVYSARITTGDETFDSYELDWDSLADLLELMPRQEVSDPFATVGDDYEYHHGLPDFHVRVYCPEEYLPDGKYWRRAPETWSVAPAGDQWLIDMSIWDHKDLNVYTFTVDGNAMSYDIDYEHYALPYETGQHMVRLMIERIGGKVVRGPL